VKIAHIEFAMAISSPKASGAMESNVQRGQMLGSNGIAEGDPLDSPDFDAVAFMNKMFPTGQY
jgi:hypothetical protein